MKVWATRFLPGQDLKASLQAFVESHQIQAGFILTAVGSLQQATLRLAGQSQHQVFYQQFEIVSLVGTLSLHGLHLHIGLADAEGKTLGGHLVAGCEVYTTAEVVIGESEEHVFLRTSDAQTGFKELSVIQNYENSSLTD